MDVRVKFPNLFELFTILFGVDAESRLIDAYCNRRVCCGVGFYDLLSKDTDSLSRCFTWTDSEEGHWFWDNLYVQNISFEDLREGNYKAHWYME